VQAKAKVSPRVPLGVRVDRVLRIPRIENIGAASAEQCPKGSTVIDLGCTRTDR